MKPLVPNDVERRTVTRRVFAAIVGAALLSAGAMLSGCTSTFANLPWVGEPAGIPERSETPAAYPAVHDMPPARETKPLSEQERKDLETELVATRQRQANPAKPTPKKTSASK